MNKRADKSEVNKSQPGANYISPKLSERESALQFLDNRSESITHQKLQGIANNSPQSKKTAQMRAVVNNHCVETVQKQEIEEQKLLPGKFESTKKKENNTGFHDSLKSGIENLSGYSLDDVKAHYNSAKPAQLRAKASDQLIAQRKSELVQMEKVAPTEIAEGQWAHVGTGGNLHFTALAAGCMAVAAEFSDGGGAGVHLAMLMDPVTQWSQFRNAIAAKAISAVHLYSDMIGEAEGWYVKQKNGVPETEMSPRSAWMLNGAPSSQNGANDWVYDTSLVSSWFQATLGAGVQITVTNGAVDHVCP